jgi:hypothetical protein
VNQGPHTMKMMGLVGANDFDLIMQLYTQLTVLSEDSGAMTVLMELERLQKSLHKLRKRGYLTDEGETAIYGSFLQNLGVWDKPNLFYELSLSLFLPKRKTGPKDQYAFDVLIFLLKEFCGNITAKKPFWPILADFLEEQGIKESGETCPEELKTRYHRCRRRLEVALIDQAEFWVLTGKLNFSDNFDFGHWAPLVCSEIYDAPKEVRAKVLGRLFPKVAKICLDSKAKKKK